MENSARVLSLNSVESIMKDNKKSTLTDEKRLIIKQMGRPKPQLNLIQTVTPKKDVIKRYYFNMNTYDSCNWICGCDQVDALFCFPCLLFDDKSELEWTDVGIRNIKTIQQNIKAHESTIAHLNNCLNFAFLGVTDLKSRLDGTYKASVKQHNGKVDQNRSMLTKIIKCIEFCGSHQLNLNWSEEEDESDNPPVLRGLINFMQDLDDSLKGYFEKLDILDATTKLNLNELLESIVAVTQEEIISDIKQSPYVALQVTMNDRTGLTMVYILRYLKEGEIYERFWKVVSPRPRTVDDITEHILKELECLQVTPQQLISQCYDGTQELIKVQSNVQQVYPRALYTHCFAHPLDEILYKSCTFTRDSQTFFYTLRSFFIFYSESLERMNTLDEVIQIQLQPQTCNTEYQSSFHRCVTTILTYKDKIIESLYNIGNSFDHWEARNNANHWAQLLEKDTFLYWLNLFNEIMPPCKILFKQMEQNENIVKELSKKPLKIFKQSITEIKTKVLKNVENSADDKSTLTGKKRRLETNKDLTAAKMCDNILSEMETRFKYRDYLVLSSLFVKENYKDYIKKFPNHHISLLKEFTEIDTNKLKNELIVFYKCDEFHDANVEQLFYYLFNNPDISVKFSEIMKLLQLLCVVPMVTEESDRCSSKLKKVQAYLETNSCEDDTLCALTMLCAEKDYIRNIKDFCKRVIDHYSSVKEREMDLVYKK